MPPRPQSDDETHASPYGLDLTTGIASWSYRAVILVILIAVLTNSIGINKITPANRTSTLDVTVKLRRTPKRQGNITYEYQFNSTDGVQTLQFDAADEWRVLHADGFVNRGDDSWGWDGDTTRPSLVAARRVNHSTRYGMSTVDTAEFAFIDVSDYRQPVSWTPSEQVRANFSIQAVGEGYVGETYAYLGPVERQTVAGDPTVRFVVPANGTPETSPEQIQQQLSVLEERFDISVQQSTLTVFTPPPPIREGGAMHGDEFWVQSQSPVHVYYHEYIHTQQAFIGELDDDLAWLVEASAEYYEIQAQHQLVGIRSADRHQSFSDQLRAADGQQTVLTEPTPEEHLALYEKGAHVLAALDLEIREATAGEKSLEDVLYELNRRATDEQRDEPIDYAEFKQIVTDIAGQSFDDWLDNYVDSPGVPPLPENPAAKYGTYGHDRQPVAPDYQFTIESREPLRVDAPGVLANASDPDGHDLIATEVEPAVASEGVVHPNGTVVVTPDAESRLLTITYRITDETGATDTGTVTLFIEPDPTPPD